ncbi:MAG: hypothetical protein AAF585_12540 [Verrucomicrobiota bacterium]
MKNFYVHRNDSAIHEFELVGDADGHVDDSALDVRPGDYNFFWRRGFDFGWREPNRATAYFNFQFDEGRSDEIDRIGAVPTKDAIDEYRDTLKAYQ